MTPLTIVVEACLVVHGSIFPVPPDSALSHLVHLEGDGSSRGTFIIDSDGVISRFPGPRDETQVPIRKILA